MEKKSIKAFSKLKSKILQRPRTCTDTESPKEGTALFNSHLKSPSRTLQQPRPNSIQEPQLSGL